MFCLLHDNISSLEFAKHAVPLAPDYQTASMAIFDLILGVQDTHLPLNFDLLCTHNL